jgi:molybdopterin-binding protein
LSSVSLNRKETDVNFLPIIARFPWQFLGKEDKIMRISARNQLEGKIKHINTGAVNSEVTLELAGGVEIISIITNSSVKALGLRVGKEACAVIKASNVMIAVD